MSAGKEIEAAFNVTSKLIFGEPLTELDDYEDWFGRRVPKGDMCKSTISGKEIYVPKYAAFRFIPHDRVADAKSFMEVSGRKIIIDEKDGLVEISKKIGRNSIFITEFEEGTNQNVKDSTIYLNVSNAYKMVDCFHSKNIAYSFFSDDCDHAFGVTKSFKCGFCINVHDSRDCVRSFEVDFSKNCADVMFCHNVDNIHSSMFCFNTKNLRYAICNQVVGKEAYEKARKMLCGYMLEKLKKGKKLDLDIYNIGGHK